MCEYGKLDMSDLIGISTVADAAAHNATVRRMVDDIVIEGTARSIGTDTGMFDFETDIRGQYLRVTSNMGIEHFWLVSDLADELTQGAFAVD